MKKDSVCQCGSTDNRSDSQPSFTEFWRPGRIVSLWDMIRELYMADFMDLSRRIEREMWRIHQTQNPEISGRKSEFEFIRGKFFELGFEMSGRQCDRILARYFAEDPPILYNPVTMSYYPQDVSCLSDRLEDECRSKKFITLDSWDASIHDQNQFNSTAQRVFDKSITDMVEAGRCLALARYPASVFHLMRIYDAGVKKLYTFFDLSAPNRNIGKLLEALREALRKGKTEKDPEKERRASDLLERLTALKDFPRDPLNHSDEELPENSIHSIENAYTPDSAFRHFTNVKDLVNKIAEIVDPGQATA